MRTLSFSRSLGLTAVLLIAGSALSIAARGEEQRPIKVGDWRDMSRDGREDQFRRNVRLEPPAHIHG